MSPSPCLGAAATSPASPGRHRRATAHAHDAIVYTRNAADLAGLDDPITITPV